MSSVRMFHQSCLNFLCKNMERVANLYRSEMVEKYMKSYLSAHDHEAIVFLKREQDWVVRISEIEIKSEMAILKFKNPLRTNSDSLRATVCEPSYDDLFANIDWDCESRLLNSAYDGRLNLDACGTQSLDTATSGDLDPNNGLYSSEDVISHIVEAVIETSCTEKSDQVDDGPKMTSL
jgi:hypothetical protein